VCSDSELTSETVNSFRYFSTITWAGDRLITVQHNTEERGHNIHASTGIRTHDPSVRAVQDHKYLRPRGH
jgi:hypothetical protein